MAEPLSPAAQAVLDAVEDDCIHPADRHRIAAAALRVATDEVVPVDRRSRRQCNIRAKLLALAAELEGGDGR
jgi:hypothetical protein